MSLTAMSKLVLLVLLVVGPARASIWPSAAARIERELRLEDPAARRKAAEAIAGLPRGPARRLLDLALVDPSADVRLVAAEVAARIQADQLGTRLSAWLSDPDSRIRLAAAETLGTRPDPQALGALARASSDADQSVRAAVARALGASGSAEAVVPLLGRLDDPVPEVRRQVVLSLGRLRDPRAVIPLLAKVEDSAGVVRRAVARALGALGDARAVGALVLVLRDSDETVRIAALDAVGRLGDASAVSSVIAVLSDAKEEVRAAAVRALGRLGTKEATAAVVAELGRPGANVAQLVAALGHGRERALTALRACVEARGGYRAADGCVLSLGTLGDASDVPRVRRALERSEVSPRAALEALGLLGSAEALPTVLEYLADPDAMVRRAALISLVPLLDPERPDGRAVDPLVRALRARGRSPWERAAVLVLLGRTRAERAAAVLADVAKNATEAHMAAAALDALGAVGPAGFDGVLLEKLDHEDGAVRAAAALALRRAGSGRAAARVLARLEGAAGQDPGALAIALPGVVARASDPHLVGRLTRLLASSRGPLRDGLIEALGEAGPAALASLAAVARGADALDRAKLAEVLAGRSDGAALARALSRDRDTATRAAAVWALGLVGAPDDLSLLRTAFRDRDGAVAANAVAAFGRLAVRARKPAAPLLCPLLSQEGGAVRVNALGALGLTGERCEPGVVETLLLRDRSVSVRVAAARLLTRSNAKSATDALSSCADEDESARVAAACAGGAPSTPRRVESVLVYVVPSGESLPAPGAAFALGFADGVQRIGKADRRGAVYERRAPAGALSLGLWPLSDE
jgi:cellulose synthase operon protein C